MTPSIEQAGIPMIIGGSAPTTTHSGDPWVFRTRPNAIYSARAQTTFAVSTLHLSRIALFYNDNTTGKEIHRLQRGDLKALGVTPVTEQAYPVLAHDLTAQVLAIKKSGATALITEGQEPSDYRLLARQMRQVGVHLAWVGDPIVALTAVLPGATLLRGTYAVTDYIAAQSPEATAFDQALRAAYHIPGGFPEALTYDGLQILARVMRKVGTNPQAIRRGILSIRGYRGVEGTYNFDRNGDGLHQYTVVQNVQGRLRVVKVLSF
jgi:branched-chain amino acid transport system substrate-binding protein